MTAPLSALLGDSATGPQSPEEAWTAAAQLLVQDASDYFESAARAGAGDPRAIALGRATCLLNLQPKTEGNLRGARELLEGVISANRTDEPGLHARYLLARIAQVHAFEPDRAAAIRIYSELYAEVPAHPLAQCAIVRASLLRLYAPGAAEAKRPLLAEFAELAPRLTDPTARRELEQVLADAWMQVFDSPADALPHLLEIDRLGLARRTSRMDLWVRTAEMARLSGRTDLAAMFYRRFLEATPRDARVRLVRERLAEVEGAR